MKDSRLSLAQPPVNDGRQRPGLVAWFAENPVAANLLMALFLVGGLVQALDRTIAIATIDEDHPRGGHGTTDDGNPAQLLLGDEASRRREDLTQGPDVDVRKVIGDEDPRLAATQMLQALVLDA